MGNGSSQEEVDKVGYRVLGVQPNSPAAVGGLVSFFDFIVAAKGVPLATLDATFVDLIKSSEDQPLPLTVYNCKSHTRREVVLVPSRKWPGEGMLGVTIRFDSYHDAEEHLCRVTEVEVNSPADLAGLLPDKDYLLGTAEKVFRDTDVLYEELAANLETPVEFYVYNADSDEVRIAVVMPSDQWGGEGLLGAGVAHGFLHGLPSSCCNTIGISNIVATKSLSSPFGYNDCDTSQYINYSQPTHQQPSSSSNVLNVNMTMERDSSGSDAQPNSDGIFNRLNQYPLPMPPLPPNVQLPYQTVAPTTIEITLKPPQRG